MVGTSNRIPQYLKARTEDELLGLMLSNNLKKGREFEYFSIQFVKNNWFAWYYFEVDLKEKISKEVKAKAVR